MKHNIFHYVVVIATLATLSLSPILARSQQSTDLVGDWNFNGNGSQGVLSIISISSGDSQLYGTVYGQPIIGFWSESQAQIIFIRQIPGWDTDVTKIQIFTGYVWRNNDGSLAMAGTFEGFAGTGGTAARHVVGWYATKQ